MRDFRGIAYASLPEVEDPMFMPRVRDIFGDLDYFLRDLSRGVERIQQGQIPDGSGTPIASVGVSDIYFLLAGRSGGQIGYGDTLSGGNLTLGSTSSATKGLIKLGVSTAYDETNLRFGIGTLAPAAKFEIHQTGTNVTYSPNSTTSGTPQWRGQDSGSSLHTYVNETVASDAEYITDGTNLGVSVRLGLPNIPAQAATATITVSFRMGWFGTNGGTAGVNTLNLLLRDGAGTTIHTDAHGAFIPSGAHGDVAFTTFTFTLSAAEITAIANWNGMSLQIDSGGGGIGYAGSIACSWMQVAVVGGSAVPLVSLYNISDVLAFRIDQNGRYDADAAGALAIIGAFDNSTPFLKYMDSGSGFATSVVGIALTADRTVSFPDGSGEILLGNATQNVQNKTFTNQNSKFNVTTTGPQFRNSTSTTQFMTWDLTALSASRIKKWQNDASTISEIVAPTSATTDKTGQTASIGATTVYTTVHAGFYRLSSYAVFTAVTVPGNFTITALYTDPQQAQTNPMINAIAYTAAGNFDQGSCVFYATAGSVIQFSTTLTGTGTYNVYVRVESLT